MTSDTVDTDTLGTDDMHVVWPRAAGLDVHKMCITAAMRRCEAGSGPARTAVRQFSALPDGQRTMTDWLRGHGVTAAALEGTGVYWQAPFEALEEAGIHADPWSVSVTWARPPCREKFLKRHVPGLPGYRSAVLGLKGEVPTCKATVSSLNGPGALIRRHERGSSAWRRSTTRWVKVATGICPAPTERVSPSVNNLATSPAGIAGSHSGIRSTADPTTDRGPSVAVSNPDHRTWLARRSPAPRLPPRPEQSTTPTLLVLDPGAPPRRLSQREAPYLHLMLSCLHNRAAVGGVHGSDGIAGQQLAHFRPRDREPLELLAREQSEP